MAFHYLRLFIIILILLPSGFCSNAGAEEALSWQDCLREAAKNHPDLIAARESVKQSQAAKTITASALFPQVDSRLSAQTARTDTGSISSTADSYSYGVSASQLFFDGSKTINDVRAASEDISASKQSFRFTSATVRFRLRSAFINLLKSQESLKIAEEIFEIRRQNLELITLKYESGQEHRGALLTAEADLARSKYVIAQARRDFEVSQRELAKEMGRKELVPMQVTGGFEIKEAVKEKPDLEALAENNPSLLQAAARASAANFSLRSAYANFSPALTGSAAATKTSQYWAPKNDQWNLGLALSMPVFEGGLRFAQVSQAKALLNQLRENQRSTKDSVVLTMEQAWAALLDALDNLEVQKKSLFAAEERSKIAEAQYSVGFISFDNWTIIQDNLVSAKTALLDAQAQALAREAEWVQAKGETLEYE